MSQQFNGIIEKAHITKFRKFSELDISCGKKMTIIAGQNGTQKTTLLGLLAHPFSMSKKDPEDTSPYEEDETNSFYEFKTLTGYKFQSKFANKFKFDANKEKAKDHEYTLFMVDKTNGNNGQFTLESIWRKSKGSQTLRIWKKGARDAGDGYMNYPVIYLSLKRVSPIGEEKKITNYTLAIEDQDTEFMRRNYNEILSLSPEKYETNELKSTNKATWIAHPSSYSALTVSAGQDNIGSILTAILSFKKLKEAFPNEYKGGLLFIDEIESTLYPAAQENLMKKLFKFARDFQLQIFCTTHSPSIIEVALDSKYKNDCAFNYLKLSSESKVTLDTNITPEQIYAHLSLKPLSLSTPNIEKIRVYTEDEEARIFIKSLLPSKYTKLLDIVNVNIGSQQLIDLKNRRIKEFTNNLIILDGDQIASGRNIITLPGNCGPDKLLYDFLFKEPINSDFWPDNKTTGTYSKQICFRNFSEPPQFVSKGDLREFYKSWIHEQYKGNYFGKNNQAGFKFWCNQNPKEVDIFILNFIKTYNFLAKKQNLPLLVN